MAETRKTPLALELVAAFIWISSLVSLGLSALSVYAADHTVILLTDVLNLYAAGRLLALRGFWRKYLIVYCWLAAGLTARSLLFFQADQLHEPCRDFPVLTFWNLVVLLLFNIASLAVLHHPKIRTLFAAPPPEPKPEG